MFLRDVLAPPACSKPAAPVPATNKWCKNDLKGAITPCNYPIHLPDYPIRRCTLRPYYLDAIHYGGADLATRRRLGEFKGRQELYTRQTPEVLGELQTVATIESSESSNRLESPATAMRSP